MPTETIRPNQIQLVLLRLLEISRPLPIAATVAHRRVEHRPVDLIANVIMVLADVERVGLGLMVQQLPTKHAQRQA